MASVYKSLSKTKKGKAPPRAREEDDLSDSDVEMDLERLDDESDSDSESEEEEVEEDQSESAGKQAQNTSFLPKTRVLMLTSRGVTYRYGRKISTLDIYIYYIDACLANCEMNTDNGISSPISPLSSPTHIKKASSTRKNPPGTISSSTPSPTSTPATLFFSSRRGNTGRICISGSPARRMDLRLNSP